MPCKRWYDMECTAKLRSETASAPVVLLVGDQVAPLGLRAATLAGALPHRQVAHELVGGGAVPVPLARGRVDGLAGMDLDDLAAAGLDEADALGDVEGLAQGVAVPGGAGARGDADEGGGE